MKKSKHLILEYTEFNASQIAPSTATDPSLSFNAFDRNQDMIRQANAKLNAIVGGLTNTASWANLRKQMTMDSQNISALKILRILPNTNSDWDVYIEFIIDEQDYWGVIRNIAGEQALSSEVFKDAQHLYITKEWIIKTKGIILNAINKFLEPETGNWRSLKEVHAINVNTGALQTIQSGTTIKLQRVFDNKIVFSIGNNYYQMSGKEWVYFNYWFEKVD